MTRPPGARAALALGLLSFLFPILGPLAAWLGARALLRTRGWPEPARGRTSAVLGLAAGLLSSALLALGLAYVLVAAVEATLQ